MFDTRSYGPQNFPTLSTITQIWYFWAALSTTMHIRYFWGAKASPNFK